MKWDAAGVILGIVGIAFGVGAWFQANQSTNAELETSIDLLNEEIIQLKGKYVPEDEIAGLLQQDSEFLSNIRMPLNGELAGHCAIGNQITGDYKYYSVIEPATVKKATENDGWLCG